MARHHRLFALLVDPADVGAPPPACLGLPGDVSLSQAAAALTAALDENPALKRLGLRIGDETVGVVTRTHVTTHGLPGPGGGPGEDNRARPRGPGAGDGATWPGTPIDFEIIEFRCVDASCDRVELRIHVDDDPACPDEHGNMELMP
ncbi:hypothetical protein ACFWCA_43200 [Streptomyces phaeochromogenes]|uniref:hypothetical protein n=1 Tax=Streptomyces phaeochromogenes TaxID=1923 RepID=UPI003675B929